MEAVVLNNRGQVSIEFIIIIVIALIYLNAVTNPLLITTSTAAAQDVKRVGDAKIAAQTLANAANSAIISPGESRRTISLFLPAGTSVSCDNENKEIDYTAAITDLYGRVPFGCGNATECGGTVKLIAYSNGLTCLSAMDGPLYMAFVVAKDVSGAITVGPQGSA